jgi:hypothetical protein
MFIMHGIITEMRNYFSQQMMGDVSYVKANRKRVRQLHSSTKTQYINLALGRLY